MIGSNGILCDDYDISYCEDNTKQHRDYPCLLTDKQGCPPKASDCEDGIQMFQKIPLKDEDPISYKCRPNDSECLNHGWYANIVATCKNCQKSNCCTINDGCSSCEPCPDNGCCSSDDSKILMNTKWKRKSNSESGPTMGCCYRGGNKFYYDGGSACSELVCAQGGSNAKWMELTYDVKSNDRVGSKKDVCSGDTSRIYVVTGESADKIDSYFKLDMSNSQKSDDVYILMNDISLPTTGDNIKYCSIVTTIKTDKYIYDKISIVPKDFGCYDFSDTYSQSLCEYNCLNKQSKDSLNTTESCSERCKPIKINDDYLSNNYIHASSTNFAFGGTTSCFCNGHEIENKLKTGNIKTKDASGKDISWVGIATPSWLTSPFSTNKPNQPISGADSIATRFGDGFGINCSSGPGGCGTCWELNTKDGKKVNGVVLDTCEDGNVYGNNWNWCTAQRPDLNTWTGNKGYSGHFPSFFKQIPWASTNTSTKDSSDLVYNSPNCYNSDGEFICKNMNMYPLHIDVAYQDYTEEQVSKNELWEKNNPKLKVKKITCPKEIKDLLYQNCGQNSGAPQTISEYCPGYKKSEIERWISLSEQ